MLNQVAEAIELHDYKTAVRLLKPLLKSEPKNLWVQYYAGRVYEGTGKPEAARKLYRKLLPLATNPKLMSQLRQGIERLQVLEQEQRRRAIADAVVAPGGDRQGVLVLEPLAPDLKQPAALQFARIMQLDPYTARLQLPSRGWRLYRTGPFGELRYYCTTLTQAGIPSFCNALEEIGKIEILTANYFQFLAPEVTVRCQNPQGQIGSLSFAWSEVSQGVEGRVPLFESVVVVDAKHRLQRKTQTQDYAHFFDLHLPGRNCILRVCDRHYQFQQGVSISPSGTTGEGDRWGTVSKSWNQLTYLIRQSIAPARLWSDFSPFAETALGFGEMLERIDARINLKRRDRSSWDAAFQLYSGLAFWRSRDRAQQNSTPVR